MLPVYILTIIVLYPFLGAVLSYFIKKEPVRKWLVLFSTVVIAASALILTGLVIQSGGKLEISHASMPAGIDSVIEILDLLLLAYVMYVGFSLKKSYITALAVLQGIPVILFKLLGSVSETESVFIVDYLSLVLVLLASIIGPVIMIFATGYMKEHEQHQHLAKSRQPRFFMILFAFLGAMNALVISDNLMWVYFFWEVTTLCSFLLISHDKTEEAVRNAARALWINLLGGVAFIFAIIFLYKSTGTLSIHEIVSIKSSDILSGMLPIGLGLLCFAGFTKAAQFPFQSWLLGAMVAPTPVSALLHSSTMVKAGVYIIVRMAPVFSGTILGKVVAVVGGFTFVAGSAIAISQRNGKRVLAYSTIANLGLIICCAGIGTFIAMGAAIMLIIFHAVSKGLLFLCIGTIEQGIGSRDIEDMQGLMKKMPFTTVITVIGMISMLLPPFGVLITKWLAIESAVNSPLVLIMIILGSAFTVVFWAKWIGIILTMSYKTKYNAEKLPFTVRGSLAFLVTCVMAASILIAPLFDYFVKPQVMAFNLADPSRMVGSNGGIWLYDVNNVLVGGFESILFFLIILAIMVTIPYFLHKTKPERIKPPYLCGENTQDMRGIEFTSAGDKVENVVVHNYYLSGFFGENNLTIWANLVAVAIILVMFGAVIS